MVASQYHTGPNGILISRGQALNELVVKPWPVPQPGAKEIGIKVMASGINFLDIMCVSGIYPAMPDYPFVLGMEVAGVVSAVGEDIDQFKKGDEVIAIAGKQLGGHAGYVNVPAMNAVLKPAGLSFEEASSLPAAFCTAFFAFRLAGLSCNEHVLVQTATGGCGLMAIQLARLKNCVIYGTSSKEEKLGILRKLGIPHVINYRTTAFDKIIAGITAGKGLDVVLNMLAGDAIQQGINCLGFGGRYLELAVYGLKNSQALDLSALVQNQIIYSINLRELYLRSWKGFGYKEMLEIMTAMVEQGTIVPIVTRIYPLSKFAEAMQFIKKADHIGKVVISHHLSEIKDCKDNCIQRLIGQNRAVPLVTC